MAQPTHAYAVLEPAEEDALHAKRLLTVEERPFTRVLKTLTGKDSLIRSLPKQLPSPPPDAGDSQDEDALKREKVRQDILLDFANLESSIIRIQLIQASNQRERERYAAEKAKILEAAQAVKDNTVELRAQLLEAQKVLELRKGYDRLAHKILDDRKVKSREESQREIERLEKEIEDLQQESEDYEATWVGRREQFDRIVAEGQTMVKIIRGIKDDAEDEKEEGEGEEENDEESGTPAPGERTPMPLHGSETPLPGAGDGETEGHTPRPANRFLDVDDQGRPSSSSGTPLHAQSDVEMIDTSVSAAVASQADEEAPAETMDES